MTALQQHVRRTIRRHDLCPSGSRVLVGVSGGSDSVALILILLELSKHGGFAVAGLAHLNHRLRETAERDEMFCRQLGSRLCLPVIAEAIDVRAHARERGLSVEDAARRVRYDFLARAALALGADRVAVGHTQDDQAETFLLKLMRGAGMAALGSIYPVRGQVIRPLLDVARADLRAYLSGRGELWVDDESNDDLDNPRNRVRHVVLPELDRAADGPTRPTIARTAALLREDGQWLDELARQRFQALAADTTDGLELDSELLQREPGPLGRRVLLQALRRVAEGREVGLEHVEAVLGLLGGAQGAGLDAPGCRVELRAGKLVLIQKADAK